MGGSKGHSKLLEKNQKYVPCMLAHLTWVIYSIWIYGKSVFTFKAHCTSGILQRIKQHTILINFRHFKLVELKDIILTSTEPFVFWWLKRDLHLSSSALPVSH